MAQSFPEKYHLNLDQKKLDEGLARVFGEKESVWCDQCEKRKSYCECGLATTDQGPSDS